MVKCKNCKKLEKIRIGHLHSYKWCPVINDNPDVECDRDCYEYECMTNADRIRSMTDEELAGFLSCDCDDVINCKDCKEPVNEYGSCSGLCRYEYLRWLKSEVGCE